MGSAVTSVEVQEKAPLSTGALEIVPVVVLYLFRKTTQDSYGVSQVLLGKIPGLVTQIIVAISQHKIRKSNMVYDVHVNNYTLLALSIMARSTCLEICPSRTLLFNKSRKT